MSRAVELVHAAADAGVDVCKFQCFNADVQGKDIPTRDMLRMLELSVGQLEYLADLCRALGVEFLCTGFCINTASVVATKLGVSRMKIGSGQVEDRLFVKHVGAFGLPVLISNGMCTDTDMDAALQWCPDDTTILYCVSLYPTPDDAINLGEIARLRKRFNKKIGFSCHSPSIWPSIAAAAVGAEVIEKHITFDRSAPGPDHSSSITTGELAHWVKEIRSVSG